VKTLAPPLIAPGKDGKDKGLAGVGGRAYNQGSRDLIWRPEALDLAVFFQALT